MEYLAGFVTGLIFGVAAASIGLRHVIADELRRATKIAEPPLMLLDPDDRDDGAITG